MLSILSTIKGKLAVVIGLFVAVAVVQAVVLMSKADEVSGNISFMRDTSSAIVSKSYELKLAVVQVQQWLTDISATRGLDGLNDGFDQAATHAEDAERLMDELAALYPAKADLFRGMHDKFGDYYATGKRMAEAYVAEGPQGGNQLMASFDAAAEAIQADVESVIEIARNLSTESLDDAVLHAQQESNWVLITSIVIAALALVAGVFLRVAVLQPIAHAAELAHELGAGDGDLTRRLDESRGDEMGDVARGINRFVEKIQTAVVSMRSVASQLSESAGHLTGFAKDGEHKANNQLTETEAVAAAMTELRASADEIANTAGETAGFTQSAGEQTSVGNKSVQRAVGVIRSLESEIGRAQGVINELGEESNSIGSVLEVIRGISEQTNLLALNAAIEAARAGEQGRGFAVVADEVRTLASRTQQSTEEIQAMITKLQTRAGESVKVMAGSRDMATESVSEVENAQNVLVSIQDGVDGIQNMTHRIAAAAQEQSQVSGDMDRNVVQIADLARDTASSAGTISAASSQLDTLAREINNLIGGFKTG
ncbi:methyl-accepting chemotaxis protein [Thiosocius teredinicola]|uniref:methyl-accepting chemotaxis protein n=1 Tax=Thiosocius teredinicola TaxID=1973002 RepID=UPI0009911D38